jgi:hypothetical protein
MKVSITPAVPPKGTKPSDYLAIAVWGKRMGSFIYYIRDQQERALREGAPIDALYERDGQWSCVSDLAPDHDFRQSYALALAAKEQQS